MEEKQTFYEIWKRGRKYFVDVKGVEQKDKKC